MAKPIPFETPPPSPHINERLRNAPAEHSDALLSAYELLQLLEDRGVLSLLKGLVGSGDQVTAIAAKALDTPDTTRGIRNFILLTKLFAGINPDGLNNVVQNVRTMAAREKTQKPPGLLQLLWRLRREDTRRAAAVALDVLEAAGKGL